MECEFINRYGDKITFIKGGNEIKMKGGDYYRCLSHTDNSVGYYAVDPSGGPFISVGMDMGYIHNDFKGLIVSEINVDKEIILKIEKMSLIEQINKDFMAAYKAKEMEKKDFLGVLKTEVTKEGKTPSDAYIISKIKSMIKNAEATNSLTDDELSILGTYLPIQLSEVELENIINNFIVEMGLKTPKDMGKVMLHLKTEYNGRYDGKVASMMTKKILS